MHSVNDVVYRGRVQVGSLLIFFLVVLYYAVVVVGRVLPVETLTFSGVSLNFVAVLFSVIGLCFFKQYRLVLVCSIACCLPLFSLLFFSFLVGGQSDYALEKIDGVIFSSLVAASFLGLAMVRYGKKRTLDSYLFLMLFILGLTVLYKGYYGFLDRSVRFLLNGPIVFGWVMGFSCVLALYMFSVFSERKYLFLVIVFILGTLWPVSKGPILAVMLSAGFVFFKASGLKGVFYYLFCAIGFLVIINFVSELPGFERLSAISRIAQSQTGEGDYGSVGIRFEAMKDSLNMLSEHPYFGVGLGEWGGHSSSGLSYPHNVIFELFSEMGWVAGTLFLAILIIFICCSGFLGFLASVYFLLCMSFSGDITYLRYLLSFLFAILICDRGQVLLRK